MMRRRMKRNGGRGTTSEELAPLRGRVPNQRHSLNSSTRSLTHSLTLNQCPAPDPGTQHDESD